MKAIVVWLFAAAVPAAFTEGSFLKEGVKPCHDFYEAVCENWIKNGSFTGEPYDNAQVSFWKEVEELLTNATSDRDTKLNNMKFAYQKCTTQGRESGTDVTNKLHSLLWKLGIPQWPMDERSNEGLGWMDLFANISIALDLSVLFDIAVKPDEIDTSSYAIKIKMPNLGIDKNIFLDPSSERKTAALGAYKEYINGSIRSITSRRTTGSKTSLPDISENIVQFETELAQISDPFWYDGPSVEDMNFTIDYTNFDYDDDNDSSIVLQPEVPDTMADVPDVDITKPSTLTSKTVANLSGLVPGIEWTALLSKLFYGAGKEVKEDDKVVLDDKTYYSKLGKLINDTKRSTLTTYFGWRVIQTMGPLIHSGLRDARRNFENAMNQSKTYKSQREVCLEEFAGEYGTAMEFIGHLYAKKHLSKEAKANVTVIVENIRNTYKSILEKTSWLSNSTRKNELYKLSMMVAKMGYADQLMNHTYIEETYKWMEGIEKNMALLDILEMFRAKKRLNELKNLHEHYNRSRDVGLVSPTSVDPYYSPQDNTFVFPSATLQKPFFNGELPSEALTGLLGWSVARVMTYGLDRNGGWFRGDGALPEHNYWSKHSREEEEKRRSCFKSLYNNHSVEGSENVRQITHIRDVGDNAGLQVAFKSLGAGGDCYVEGMNHTRNQLFFIYAGLGMCLSTREVFLRRPEDAKHYRSAKQRVHLLQLKIYHQGA
ncbi:neprilysin-1-like isoform X2 [Ornithodoros turicata]|uniref:neprilysin-1-like isoform X2 n=1 Tax=Ornithodoros turicata TaxID=34597 RepID=UPI0031391290